MERNSIFDDTPGLKAIMISGGQMAACFRLSHKRSLIMLSRYPAHDVSDYIEMFCNPKGRLISSSLVKRVERGADDRAKDQ